MLLGKTVLLTLAKERDLAPLERSISVAEGAVEALPVGLQQARDGAQRGKGLALAARCQQADRLTQLDGELVRQRHGSPPAPFGVGANTAMPIRGIVIGAR